MSLRRSLDYASVNYDYNRVQTDQWPADSVIVYIDLMIVYNMCIVYL